jgi:hypothetical protein
LPLAVSVSVKEKPPGPVSVNTIDPVGKNFAEKIALSVRMKPESDGVTARTAREARIV